MWCSMQMIISSCDEMVSNEILGEIDVDEFIIICQPTKTKIMKDVQIEEVILDFQEKK